MSYQNNIKKAHLFLEYIKNASYEQINAHDIESKTINFNEYNPRNLITFAPESRKKNTVLYFKNHHSLDDTYITYELPMQDILSEEGYFQCSLVLDNEELYISVLYRILQNCCTIPVCIDAHEFEEYYADYMNENYN